MSMIYGDVACTGLKNDTRKYMVEGAAIAVYKTLVAVPHCPDAKVRMNVSRKTATRASTPALNLQLCPRVHLRTCLRMHLCLRP